MKLALALLVLAGLSTDGAALSAPDFRERTLDGKPLSLKEQLKPGRVVLLTFWATWCGPCLEELRSVSDYLAKDGSLPLDVISVNVDAPDTAADVRPVAKLHGLKFPIVMDAKQEIFGRYHPQKTLPFSVLIDESGTVLTTFSGYQESMFTTIRARVASAKK
jgi:peroxiredoxin